MINTFMFMAGFAVAARVAEVLGFPFISVEFSAHAKILYQSIANFEI